MKKGLIHFAAVVILAVVSIVGVIYYGVQEEQEGGGLNFGVDPRVFTESQGGTGTSSPQSILYGNSGNIESVEIGTGLTFSGGTLSSTGGSGNTTWEIVGGVLTPTTSLDIAVYGTGTSTFSGGVESGVAFGAPFLFATSTTASTFGGPITHGVTGAFLIQTNQNDGGSPTYSFVGDTNTGFYQVSGDTLAFSTGGTDRLLIDSTGIDIEGTGGLLVIDGTATSTNAGNFDMAGDVEADQFFSSGATSTFSGLKTTDIVSCSTSLETDADGGIVCGSDPASVGFGQAWEINSGGFLAPTTTTLSIAVGGTSSSTFSNGIEAGTLIGAPFFNATSSSATSTFVGGILTNTGIDIDTFFELGTDGSFTSIVGTGVSNTSGSLHFDCSEVEGTGINCTGEAVTLDATGDWTGTLDTYDGSAFAVLAENEAVTGLYSFSNAGTTTFSGGLYADIVASPIFHATSSTASSTFMGGIVSNILDCSQALETDSAGNIICGTDATGGGSGNTTWELLTNSRFLAPTTTVAVVIGTTTSPTGDNDISSALTVTGTSTDTNALFQGFDSSLNEIFTVFTNGSANLQGSTASFQLTDNNTSAEASFYAEDGVGGKAFFQSNDGNTDVTLQTNDAFATLTLDTNGLGDIVLDTSATSTFTFGLQTSDIIHVGSTTASSTFTGGILANSLELTNPLGYTYGGLNADVSGYSTGLFGVISNVPTDVDTLGEIETIIGSQNILLETEIDACSELVALLDDETGTCGGAVFSTSPTLTSPVFTSTTTITGISNFASSTQLFLDSIGQVGYDTTSGNVILATSSDSAQTGVVIGEASTTLYAFQVSSTSPDFVSGGLIDMPSHILAQELVSVWCKADAGTSVAINFSDGTNDTNAVTCTTTGSMFALTSNTSFTTNEAIRLEIGTVTGSVDYVTMRVYGYRTTD